MNRNWIMMGCLGLALAGLAPLAAETPVAPVNVADTRATAVGLDFLPRVNYAKAVLTVSGSGTVFTREFRPGEPLSLGFFDPDGGTLQDGTYRWELRMVPDAAAAEALKDSARKNSGVPLSPWLPKSGSFSIYQGAIASPDLVEASAGESAVESALSPGLPTILGAARADASEARQDSDELVASGRAVELRAVPAAKLSPGTAGADTSQLHVDSDGEAVRKGESAESALRPAPETAPAQQKQPVADGSNGRPRSTPNR